MHSTTISPFSGRARSFGHDLESGVELSVAAAQNYQALRARGKTVRKTVDCLIATFCILNGHVLLHADKDFDHFEKELSLKVLHS